MKNPLFLNTILFGNFSTERKLRAVAAAGFDQIEIWKEDCDAMPGGAPAVAALCTDLGLTVASVMVLRNAVGSPRHLREKKREEALAMMDLAAILGTDCIQAPSSMLVDVDPSSADADLLWLAKQAAARSLRISYEAVSWATLDRQLCDAWKRVDRLMIDNVGIELDLFHHLVRGGPLADIDELSLDRIFQIQLSDLGSETDVSDDTKLLHAARHLRLLPGDGCFPAHQVVRRLIERGYTGPIGIEVFSDEYRGMEPEVAAQLAFESLQRLIG